MKNSNKTLKVSLQHYEMLAQLGTLEDSFDSVIGRLLSSYYEQKQQQLGKGTQDQAQESQRTLA